MNEKATEKLNTVYQRFNDYGSLSRPESKQFEDSQNYKAETMALFGEALAELQAETVCKWKLDDADMNTWQTGCDNLWQLMEGTPKDNKMVYCPYCGEKINVKS